MSSDHNSNIVEEEEMKKTVTSRHLRFLFAGEQNVSKPPVIMAPMVNQSELAFRLLCRKISGNRVCYSPMINSRQFVNSKKYREEVFQTNEMDRPLITQFCGNDPEILTQAGKFVQDQCDGIDLNFGCPQKIAKRGHYGAFLLDDPDLLEKIVKKMSSELKVPISCKIRLVPGGVQVRLFYFSLKEIFNIFLKATIDLCKRLEKAGCELLTVHGRYREQNKQLRGNADWDAIREIKKSVSIPVVANGNISDWNDVERCYAHTNVDGIMSCEALLENPAIFASKFDGKLYDPFEMLKEYLQIAKIHNKEGQPKPAKAHIFKILFGTLEQHREFFPLIGGAKTIDDLLVVVENIKKLHRGDGKSCTNERCGNLQLQVWYKRHLKGGTHIPEAEDLKKLDREDEEDYENDGENKNCSVCFDGEVSNNNNGNEGDSSSSSSKRSKVETFVV